MKGEANDRFQLGTLSLNFNELLGSEGGPESNLVFDLGGFESGGALPHHEGVHLEPEHQPWQFTTQPLGRSPYNSNPIEHHTKVVDTLAGSLNPKTAPSPHTIRSLLEVGWSEAQRLLFIIASCSSRLLTWLVTLLRAQMTTTSAKVPLPIQRFRPLSSQPPSTYTPHLYTYNGRKYEMGTPYFDVVCAGKQTDCIVWVDELFNHSRNNLDEDRHTVLGAILPKIPFPL